MSHPTKNPPVASQGQRLLLPVAASTALPLPASADPALAIQNHLQLGWVAPLDHAHVPLPADICFPSSPFIVYLVFVFSSFKTLLKHHLLL